MQVEVQPDPEPKRNLLRRADQWPFLQAGIPSTAFVFGYQPGTESERSYRRWYGDSGARTRIFQPERTCNRTVGRHLLDIKIV